MRRQPDIVLLVLDTQRVDRLSCYGYKSETTPHLDLLVKDATLFKHAIAPAQWTVPTHASIFTGLYPSQHTVHQMDSVLPPELFTLAERLQRAGYYTAGFSHNPLVGVVKNGLQRGFHSFHNYNRLGAGLLSVHLSRPNVQLNGIARIRRLLRLIIAESLGYSQHTPAHLLAPVTLPLWKAALRLKGRTKEMSARHSLAAASELFIERSSTLPGQPIFTFINLMGTHVPYDPPQWAIKRFLPGDLRQAVSVLQQRANNWQVDVCNWLDMELAEAEFKAILDAFYDAEVAAQDAQVGWFVDRLRIAGALDNTLFIVVADHGDHLGEKQRINHAFGVYQQLTHVPLLIRDPSNDLPRGTSVESFVSTRRIFHTILAAVGTATSEEEELTLAHSVTQASTAGREVVFTEGWPLEWAVKRLEKYRPDVVQRHQGNQPTRAVYTDGYKLIATARQRELYALREDPDEEVNLSQQLLEKVELLDRQMVEFVQRLQPVARKMTQQQEEDAAVLEQLRHLGYLE